MIQTATIKQAAATTTEYESPERKAKAAQSPDLPQTRSSGDEHPEHHQVPEARLNRQRQHRNWPEAAMADVPVLMMRHTIRIR